MLSLEHASFTYRGKRSPGREIFRDISLGIAGGDCVALLGREGSGKSTLLRLMDGLLVPEQGTLNVDGADFHAITSDAAGFRKRIGFAFQFPEEQFMCESVRGEFEDLLKVRGLAQAAAAEIAERALMRVGLDPALLMARSPFTLSLGESRRAALAMLLAIEPEIVIMDEPTAGLDANGVAAVARILTELLDRGAGVLIATHDVDFAAELATRVVILDGGTIASAGTAGKIFTDHALLERHGYQAPEAVRVAKELRRSGRNIPAEIFRAAELRALPGLQG